MQTAQERERDDVATFRGFGGAWIRAILGQRPMGAVAVKIVHIVGQNTPQVVSVEHDHLVQAFAPNRTDPSLAQGFCEGERGAMSFSSRPRAKARAGDSAP